MSTPAGPQRRPTAAEARAEVEARSKAERAQRDAAMAERFGDSIPGWSIVQASMITTGLFVVMTVAASWINTRPVRIVVALVDSALFLAGCAVFLKALYDGAQRSRWAEMTMAGWWFLSGTAPKRVQQALLGCLGVQVFVGLAGAAARRESLLAFGILVPTLGLAFCGLWSARHGLFPPRVTEGRTPP